MILWILSASLDKTVNLYKLSTQSAYKNDASDYRVVTLLKVSFAEE